MEAMHRAFLARLEALPYDLLVALIERKLADKEIPPAGIFDELTALTDLFLIDNSLAELPDDVFEPLTSLSPSATVGQSGVALQPDGGGAAR